MRGREKAKAMHALHLAGPRYLKQRGRLRDKTEQYDATTLREFLFQVSPDLDRSMHLGLFLDILDTAPGASLRKAVHAPPQHGKTTSIEHGLLWWDYLAGKGVLKPYEHAYVSYNITIVREKAIEFRHLAARAGFEPRGTLNKITLKNGSVIRFTSVGSTLTGNPVTGVFVVDDPHANRSDALSIANRRKVISWWRSTAKTRRHPGTSYIVMATRWHMRDLTGIVIEDDGFDYLCLKAIAEGETDPETGIVFDDPLGRKEGEALWPSERPVEFFDEDKKYTVEWNSMYQGNPLPEGSRVFHEPGDTVEEEDDNGNLVTIPRGPQSYDVLPSGGYKVAFGLDLAGTAKKKADWSVLVEARAYKDEMYIVDVVRKQTLTPDFGRILKEKQKGAPRAKFRWYTGGQEKSIADLYRSDYGVRGLKVLPATANKLARAMRVSGAWNSGRVFLPTEAAAKQYGLDLSWYEPFVTVVCEFTGAEADLDDDVDALAACYDELFPKRRKFGG